MIHGRTIKCRNLGDCCCRQIFKVVATTRKQEKISKLKAAGADHVILDHQLEEHVPKLFPANINIILKLVRPD